MGNCSGAETVILHDIKVSILAADIDDNVYTRVANCLCTHERAILAIFVIESKQKPVQLEHFDVIMEPVKSNGSGDADTDNKETKEGFVDAQTDSDAVQTVVTEVHRLDKENENLDTISCDTTSTDSTRNTVIGVNF